MEDLVRRGDPEELLLEVDRLAAARDWDGLVALRDRCEAAVEHGRQLWSVAQYTEYRLALEAPGPYAAAVCGTGSGRFTLGPLTEVAAQSHRWEDLAPHLTAPWVAATVAQERVVRGEDLTGDERAHPEELDLPLVLLDWEPDYPLPTYRSHDLLEGGPAPISGPSVDVGTSTAEAGDHPRLLRALGDLATTWAEHSNGGCNTVVVRGDALDAAAQVAPGAVATEVGVSDAVSRIAWAAASGGAYGRRSGMAAGRSSAFWVASLATGLGPDTDPQELGEQLSRLRWWVIDDGREGGWKLGLAVSDPDAGWAAAVNAWDAEDAGVPLRRSHGSDAWY